MHGAVPDQDFRLGPWLVRPSLNSIALGGKITRLEPKVMEVLVCLAQDAGGVVSKDRLISTVWNDAFVGDDVLTRSISELRKAFDDDPRAPRIIETIPKRGYRILEKIEAVEHRSPHWTERLVAWLRKSRIVRIRRAWWALVATILAVIPVVAWVGSPQIARFCNNRGTELQQQGQLKGAMEAYELALRFNSSYAEAHYNLGDSYEVIPNYEKALDEYQRAIDSDLTFYPAYNNLSRLYILRRRDYGAALRLIDRALSYNPQESSVKYTLYKNYGWANYELHNFGQAEKNLRLAISISPDRGGAHCLLAKVLDAQENGSGALIEWESCTAYASGLEVEPEWRNEAQERLSKMRAGK